jgi:hypothetical protein
VEDQDARGVVFRLGAYMPVVEDAREDQDAHTRTHARAKWRTRTHAHLLEVWPVQLLSYREHRRGMGHGCMGMRAWVHGGIGA